MAIRRIVTGHSDDGASTIVADGPSPHRRVREATGLVVTDLWRTTSAPASPMPDDDGCSGTYELAPPRSGTVFRIVEFPPDGDWLGRVTADELRSAGDESAREAFSVASARPDMHRTRTLDYAIVIEGEIVAVLERAEASMSPGDVLVQCATVHAWSNRTDQPCKVAFVLVDADPGTTAVDDHGDSDADPG